MNGKGNGCCRSYLFRYHQRIGMLDMFALARGQDWLLFLVSSSSSSSLTRSFGVQGGEAGLGCDGPKGGKGDYFCVIEVLAGPGHFSCGWGTGRLVWVRCGCGYGVYGGFCRWRRVRVVDALGGVGWASLGVGPEWRGESGGVGRVDLADSVRWTWGYGVTYEESVEGLVLSCSCSCRIHALRASLLLSLLLQLLCDITF